MNKKISALEALQQQFPDSSKTTLRQWIQQGRVHIAGTRIQRANEQVEEGREIFLDQIRKKPTVLPGNVAVLFQDEHFIVVDKPAGLLSVAREKDTGRHLHGIVKKACKPKRVFPVHRLDQGTSGVLVFALSDEARWHMRELFAKKAIFRRYVAVVEGVVDQEEGSWESNLVDGKDFVVRSSKNEGRKAVTHYEVIRSGKEGTLLALTLQTGRKNQIRVHAADAGYPIVGDKKYGSQTDPIKRLCLHAESLSFQHPFTEKPLHFISPVPQSFMKIVRGGFNRDA